VTSSDTGHSIRHRPFPIGGPLEPSLYLYLFLVILGSKHIPIFCALAKKVIRPILNQRDSDLRK